MCTKSISNNFDEENLLYTNETCDSLICKCCFELKWRSILFDKINNASHLDTLHNFTDYNFYVSGDSDFVDNVFHKASEDIHI